MREFKIIWAQALTRGEQKEDITFDKPREKFYEVESAPYRE